MMKSTTRLKPETVEKLRCVSTATLCTQLFKRGFRNVFIQGVLRLTKPSSGTTGCSSISSSSHTSQCNRCGSRPHIAPVVAKHLLQRGEDVVDVGPDPFWGGGRLAGRP